MGRGASRGHLLSALDASLDRLQLDHLDLWQVHAWDGVTPWQETLAALDTAVQSGRVCYAGVSNYSGWQLGATASWQRAVPGRTPLVSNQVEYSLLQRGVEREVVPAAQELGVGLLPWSPLGRGVLTGKYRNGAPSDSRGASEHFSQFIEPYLDDRSASVVDAVLTAADGLGVSPVAVALAWVRDRPGVVAPIVGARTAAQLQASLAAEQVELPPEIRSALDDVSAPVLGYPENAFRWSSDDLED
jgi:aryl-alcohol dehydrogenase-like predicted oxidoreductase